MSVVVLVLVSVLAGTITCCDLEKFFSEKQVSVEESTKTSDVIVRGLRRSVASPVSADGAGVVVFFDFINTYKGAELLGSGILNNFRNINITFPNHPPAECEPEADVPQEYICFCNVAGGNELTAISVAKWDESADQRVWAALGWSQWSEWSSCSVSCSAGIQQRTRRCQTSNCPGFNVEQRHCNLFGCEGVVNPLELTERRYFHPSKETWRRTPDRPSAWRLQPDSYIWFPSAKLFKGEEGGRPFPRQFVLFITVRVQNNSMGTIFSLRSRRRDDSYLSLELAGSDLKLVHVAANGSDVVRIPTKMSDGRWHQISISIRDDSVVDTYIDCEWSRTDILKRDSLDIPEDADLIIGYLFTGDLDQLTIASEPYMVSLQCSPSSTPILDVEIENEIDKEKPLGHVVQDAEQNI